MYTLNTVSLLSVICIFGAKCLDVFCSAQSIVSKNFNNKFLQKYIRIIFEQQLIAMADDQETPDINFTEETPDIDFSEIVGNSAVTEKAHFGSDEAEDIDDLDEPENYVENEDGGDDIDNDDDEDTNQAATDQPKHGKT